MLVLDPLGDEREAERAPEVDDRPDERRRRREAPMRITKARSSFSPSNGSASSIASDE